MGTSILNPSTSATSPTHDHRVFPPHGASEADLLHFRDRVINPWSMYRNKRMADVALWMWFYLGQQWTDIDPVSAFDGVRGAILQESDLDMPADMPRPVTNTIDPAVEQAVIALVQRKWTAKATPTSSDPAIKAAAQVSTDSLQYRLDVLRWPEKRQQHAFHYALAGTGLLYSGVDRVYTKLRVIGSPSAVWCPACNTKLYSRDVPGETLRAGINGQPVAYGETAKPTPIETDYDTDVMDMAGNLDLQRLNYCPTCTDRAIPLQDYSPTEEEAEGELDVFGRHLGIAEPCDQSSLEVDLPQEFYPQDGGYRQTPTTIRRFGRRKIREISWIEERAPHLMDQLIPDSVSELLYNDPLLGTRDVLARWSGALDSGILDYHKNVDEVWELPSIRYPLGRWMMCLKNEVVEEGDLLIPAKSTGEDIDSEMYVPRVNLSIARYKFRPNEIWGNGIASTSISPQKRLNGLDAQIIDWRLGHGGSEVWMPADMWIANPVQIESSLGGRKINFYQQSPSMPEVTKPEVTGGMLMPSDVYMERDRVQADLQRQMGPQDASRGVAPKNVGTTSGLQELVDRDLAMHALREEELIRSGEQTFSHIQKMEWLLNVDQDVYRVLGPNKQWSYHQYTGAMIRGQVEIKIERGSSIPNSTIQREAAREAIADKILPIDSLSPVVRRELLELYGLDPDLAPDEFYQVDHAQRVWVDFRDKSIIRTQDTLDEPGIHYIVLRGHLRTEEGEQLAENIGWDDINRAVAGWQDELKRMEMLDAATIEFYGGRLNQEDGKLAYGQALVHYDQQMQLFKQQTQAHAAMDPVMKAGLQPPVQPQQPPPPIFLPALLQDRILLVWGKLLQGQLPPPAVDAQLKTGPDPQTFIKFRALVEAYRLSAAAAAMPPMQPPAPDQGGGNGGGGGAPEPNPSTSAPAPSPEPTNSTPEGGSH